MILSCSYMENVSANSSGATGRTEGLVLPTSDQFCNSSVTYGLETVRFTGPQLWCTLPLSIKQ